MSNVKEEILNSNLPVLIDFYADWCGPCKALMPTILEIAEEYKDKIKVIKVNVDNEGELASEYGVMSIPTLVFIKNKEVVNKLIGFKSKEEILQMINN